MNLNQKQDLTGVPFEVDGIVPFSHRGDLFNNKLTTNVVFRDTVPAYLMGDMREVPEKFLDRIRELAHRDAKDVCCLHWEFPEGYAFPDDIQAWLDHQPVDTSMPEGLEFGNKENEDA